MNRSPSSIDITDPMQQEINKIKPMFDVGDSDSDKNGNNNNFDFILKKSKINKISIKSF